jgi:chemotaxis protein histidine kinase CheA
VGLLVDPVLRDLFEEELADGLDAIEALLPRLADRTAVQESFGHAHALRGSAAVMGIAPVASVAAALSELFEAALLGGGAPPHGIAEPVRAAVSDLRYLASGLLNGIEVGTVGIDAEHSLRALRRSVLADDPAPAPDACARCVRLEQRIAQLEARSEAGG